MGLYGTIIVEPTDAAYWPAVDRQLSITLDDLLVEDGHIAPFHRAGPTFTAMGRFGNELERELRLGSSRRGRCRVVIEVGGCELRAACRGSVRQKGGGGHLVSVLTGGGVGSPEALVDSCVTES
jgi:hypothetical protein